MPCLRNTNTNSCRAFFWSLNNCAEIFCISKHLPPDCNCECRMPGIVNSNFSASVQCVHKIFICIAKCKFYSFATVYLLDHLLLCDFNYHQFISTPPIMTNLSDKGLNAPQKLFTSINILLDFFSSSLSIFCCDIFVRVGAGAS